MIDVPLTYKPPGPIAKQFVASNAFVRGIRGPIGSGKSTACAWTIWRHFMEAVPDRSETRKARWAVIRNTYPELKTTTIKTWHQWFPKEWGRWQDQGPPTHHIIDGKIDLEVMFLALDTPNDVAKLLSLELTGAWINEAREVPKAVLDGLTGRVGRYPPVRDGGSRWSGIIMDTNSPDTDHWWYRLAERDKPDGWEFYHQPGGLDPGAENRENLLPDYYARAATGKDEDWIKVFINADYGFVREGKPVYPEFRDSMHVRPCAGDPRLDLFVGIDFGLTPAALFAQRTFLGQWRWIDELVTEDMGAKRFGELLKAKIERDFKDYRLGGIFGDPAGDSRAQTDEETPFKILRAGGVPAVPAPSNDPVLRREAVASCLSRLIDGEPGLIISPRCDVTRKGMAGGYQYKRLEVVGEERYRDTPNKNRFSHVCEAGQYLMLGAGEGKVLLTPVGNRNRPRTFQAIMD